MSEKSSSNEGFPEENENAPGNQQGSDPVDLPVAGMMPASGGGSGSSSSSSKGSSSSSSSSSSEDSSSSSEDSSSTGSLSRHSSESIEEPPGEDEVGTIEEPVRCANGQIRYPVRGILPPGFGPAWGHTLSYSNRQGDLSAGINGEHWAVNELPHLVARDDGNRLALVRGFHSVVWFDREGQSDDFHPRFYSHDRVVHDPANGEFVHTAGDGRQTRLHDFSVTPVKRGKLKGFSGPAGQVGGVECDSADRLGAVEMSDGKSSARYEYAYLEQGENIGRLLSVVYRADGELVRRNTFEYYDEAGWASGSDSKLSSSSCSGEPPNGALGDLKRVTVQVRESGRWSTLERYYFRYYTRWDSPEMPHGLKYAVGPEAYMRMTSDSIDPLTAPDWQVAQYADYYFEYDDDRRVVAEEVMGGSQRYTLERTHSAFHPESGEYNQWVMKTVETLPDGNRNIFFTNRVGQVMLKAFESEDGTKQWCTYRRFDGKARTVLEADASAFRKVGGVYFDENVADLVEYNAGNGTAKYLRENGTDDRIPPIAAPPTTLSTGRTRCAGTEPPLQTTVTLERSTW